MKSPKLCTLQTHRFVADGRSVVALVFTPTPRRTYSPAADVYSRIEVPGRAAVVRHPGHQIPIRARADLLFIVDARIAADVEIYACARVGVVGIARERRWSTVRVVALHAKVVARCRRRGPAEEEVPQRCSTPHH